MFLKVSCLKSKELDRNLFNFQENEKNRTSVYTFRYKNFTKLTLSQKFNEVLDSVKQN